MPLAHDLDAFSQFAWFSANHDKPFGQVDKSVTPGRKFRRMFAAL